MQSTAPDRRLHKRNTSMRLMMAIVTMLMTMQLFVSHDVYGQEDVDIQAVIQNISGLDPDILIAALQTPMPNDALPSRFVDATLVDPDEVGESSGSDEDMNVSVGSVTYSLTYQHSQAETSPVQATPPVGGPNRLYNLASVQYLVFDKDLDAAALEQFDETLRVFVGDQAAGADVQHITVQDSPAFLISIETETNGIPIVIEWLAIPVGTVAVVGMTMTGGDNVDTVELTADAQALTLASVAHLDMAVKNRTAPAG